jgi:hypothetical protein
MITGGEGRCTQMTNSLSRTSFKFSVWVAVVLKATYRNTVLKMEAEVLSEALLSKYKTRVSQPSSLQCEEINPFMSLQIWKTEVGFELTLRPETLERVLVPHNINIKRKSIPVIN